MSEEFEEKTTRFSLLLVRLSEKKVLLDLTGVLELQLGELTQERRMVISERLAYDEEKEERQETNEARDNTPDTTATGRTKKSNTGRVDALFEAFKRNQLADLLSARRSANAAERASVEEYTNRVAEELDGEDDEPEPQPDDSGEEGKATKPSITAAAFLPPVDEEARVIIDATALMIVRNGSTFEQLLREKEQANDMFGFLRVDHEYNAYFRATLAQLEMQAFKIAAFDMSGLTPKTNERASASEDENASTEVDSTTASIATELVYTVESRVIECSSSSEEEETAAQTDELNETLAS